MTLDIRALNDRVAVAPQIAPEDLPAIKAAGYVAVINNRPDGEEPGQPTGAAIARAAEAAGLTYHAVPVAGPMGQAELDATAAALSAADGPVLAFCRSGTRSCNLWALAAAQAGRDPALIAAQAGAAGYDLSTLRPTLDALAGGR